MERVTLGDKEVQIWFQNRRQASRKKARASDEVPLSSSDPAEELESVDSLRSSPQLPDVEVDAIPSEDPPQVHVTEDTAHTTCPEAQRQEPTQNETQTTTTTANSFMLQAPPSSQTTEVIDPQEFSIPSSSAPTPLTSFKNASSTINRRGTTQVQRPRASLGSSSPYLRLSMTEDGKARVVDRAAQTPSPERQKPQAPLSTSNSLRRSYSAAGLTEPQSQSDNVARKMPRLAGRSRDSKMWEFWCDTDARISLADKVDKEGSGSAAEAIGLLRSNSSRALRVNNTLKNSPILGSRNHT